MVNIDVNDYYDDKDALTVKELIEILSELPQDEKVFAEWETLSVPVLASNIEVKTNMFNSEAEMYEAITGHKSKHIK